MSMYEPQATDLLTKLGLSVAERGAPQNQAGGDGDAALDRVVPVESVQALSAAMSLIGGDSGISAEVCVRARVFIFLWCVCACVHAHACMHLRAFISCR